MKENLLKQPNSLIQRYKAVIAYDGTDFLGFQVQAQGRTVQGVLEKVLAKVVKKPIRLIGAGRTDTGVHATGQVIAFDLTWQHSPNVLQRALNVNLPSDIVVVELLPIHSTFHPRFDAVNRQYQYTILNQPIRDVMRQRYSTHIASPINVTSMKQASLHILGTQDFASFGRPPQGNNTIRTVTQAEWYVDGSELRFFITANAFLYRMVRSIVGNLLQVGLGRIEVDSIKDILQAKDRSKSRALALASGLCLVNVTY